MDQLLTAALIFILRICDVSIGTMRVMHVVRGQRFRAAALALVESSIFIFAIANIFTGSPSLLKMLGYAAGFAAGTLVGVTVEGWIASGFILARIISREKGPLLRQRLREDGFGVTSVQGQGREGELLVLFVVAPRRRHRQLLDSVNTHDPDAFVTLDEVNHALGGYLPRVASPHSVRK